MRSTWAPSGRATPGPVCLGFFGFKVTAIGYAICWQKDAADVCWSDDIDWSEEETADPHYADQRNFYKVEKWTKDGTEIERLLYAGNNLEKARELFTNAVKHRPRIRLTIRQRTRVLALNWREVLPAP